MLEDHRRESLYHFFIFRPFQILVLQVDGVVAVHIVTDVGDGQTTFLSLTDQF